MAAEVVVEEEGPLAETEEQEEATTAESAAVLAVRATTVEAGPLMAVPAAEDETTSRELHLQVQRMPLAPAMFPRAPYTCTPSQTRYWAALSHQNNKILLTWRNHILKY